MMRLLVALALTVLPILLGVVVFLLCRYHETSGEKATEPLTLQCGRCGKTVYTSRTGQQIRAFTATVYCVSCASRKELKKIYRKHNEEQL